MSFAATPGDPPWSHIRGEIVKNWAAHCDVARRSSRRCENPREFHPPELTNKLPTIIGPRRIAHVVIDMTALPKHWPAEVALADVITVGCVP
jgi:hypothetical protein